MTPTGVSGWLAWVAPVIAVVTTLYAGARTWFGLASRDELLKALQEHRKERQQMHREVMRRIGKHGRRIREVERGLARLAGETSGRFRAMGQKTGSERP